MSLALSSVIIKNDGSKLFVVGLVLLKLRILSISLALSSVITGNGSKGFFFSSGTESVL
jgi:hypothetical protein